MQRTADFRATSTSLLTIEAGERSYALPGAAVLGVEHLRDWQGEAPFDVLALLGFAAAATVAEHARVAILDVNGARLPLLIHGALALIHPRAGQLLPLPPELESSTPLVSHIALVDGKPAVFVLSPSRLAHARSAVSPSPPPSSASR